VKKKTNIEHKITSEKRAGLYLTISFHLVVLIVFLCYGIKKQVETETSFVLDFTKQEELEKEQKLLELKEQVSKEVDELLASVRTQTPRNVSVRVDGKQLRDDRHKNPSDVYDQARELQKKLDANKRKADQALDSEDDVNLNSAQEDSDAEEYKGPSVLSWRLDGRSAIRLPVPAYKCLGGGDVTVAIIVNRKGAVINSRVVEEVSSSDDCLRQYALNAAGRSRFSRSETAPERQAGEIVYQFIAQ